MVLKPLTLTQVSLAPAPSLDMFVLHLHNPCTVPQMPAGNVVTSEGFEESWVQRTPPTFDLLGAEIKFIVIVSLGEQSRWHVAQF